MVGTAKTTPNSQLLDSCKRAHNAFLASGERFRIVHTVPPNPSACSSSPSASDAVKLHAAATTVLVPETNIERSNAPKTLFILDSSFNPPQRAHYTLALSALLRPQHTYPKPWRLLLLFSVHNADKNPSPAAFEARIGCMVRFAEDISTRYHSNNDNDVEYPSQAMSTTKTSTAAEIGNTAETTTSLSARAQVPIDVGLTSEPFYMDKSLAIDEAGSYGNERNELQHVHLTGYDTYTRIFTPKYYEEKWGTARPLRALEDFFERRRHGLRVTTRPERRHVAAAAAAAAAPTPASAGDKDKDDEEDEDEQRQRKDIEALGRGELERKGAKRAWMKQIEIVEAERSSDDREEGSVSSTRVRKAVKEGHMETVHGLCTPGVVSCIQEWELYES